jgi:hypothetical protein
MVIDSKTYELDENNYIQIECIKTQIILGDTFNHGMRHFKSWKNRYNGNYKKTASFTIGIDGTIYKHFDPKYQSRYFGDLERDAKTILVLLDNDGWLTKNSEKNIYNTWIGDIYNRRELIFKKKWRYNEYWSPYTKEQFESTVVLVKSLCDDFYIPTQVMAHNTKVDNLSDFNGVLYKSNFEKHFTDLNPSWWFEDFKNKVEEK